MPDLSEKPQHIELRPIRYNGILDSRFSTHARTAEESVAIYENVIFDSSTSILYDEGGMIASTRYLIDDYSVSLYDENNIIDLSSAGLICIGYNRPGRSHNHYHWLNQCLPAIYSYTLQNNGRRPVVLLPRSLNSTELRSIELTGMDLDIIYLDTSTRVRLSKAAFSNFLLGSADFRPSPIAASLFRKIRDSSLSFFNNINSGKKIYISRKDSSNRMLVNEEEVMHVVTEYGFQILTLSNMTIEEQICAFFHAEIVVAPHGAGLVNIIFCQDNCKIVELTSEFYINPCFINLSHQNILEHYLEATPADSVTLSEDGHRQEWQVGVDRLRTLLDELTPMYEQTAPIHFEPHVTKEKPNRKRHAFKQLRRIYDSIKRL